MNMNDTETVALIGGGHAVGKCHGACPSGDDGAGNRPSEAPLSPWEGKCGIGPMQGKAQHTWTSGYELAWTSKPLQFDNEFFKNLQNFNWEKRAGIKNQL